jgi:hypothetical protein
VERIPPAGAFRSAVSLIRLCRSIPAFLSRRSGAVYSEMVAGGDFGFAWGGAGARQVAELHDCERRSAPAPARQD